MKKTFFFLIVVSLLTSLFSISANINADDNFKLDHSNSNITEISFSLSDYELIEHEVSKATFTKITSSSSGEFAQPGLPDLPRFTRLIAVPDEGNVSFQVSEINQEFLSDIVVYPRQQLQSESSINLKSFTINEEFYKTGEIFPEQTVVVGDPVILRDIRLVSLTINPFQYDPVEKKLRIIKNIKVEVITNNGRGINSKISIRKKSRFFEKLYSSVIFNYDEFIGRDDEYQQPSYLFIYPNNTQIWDNLEPLVQWKHEKGFIVNAVTTLQTGTTSNQILNYISDAYNNWEDPPEFVCLVGDAGGSFNIPTGHMNGGEGDHFYTMLEGDDILSDIFIGRLSFNSITQFQTILNKIFNYERTPFMELTEWYDNAVLIGDPNASGPSTVDTKMHVKDVINLNAPNIECTEVYSGSFTTHMTNNLNSGVSYFNYRGFGGMSGWNNNYINNLSNGFMLPVAVALTCNTGDFEGTYDSINEAFLKAGTPSVPKGAIAAISTATGQTHTCFNNCMDAGIYYGFFVDDLHFSGGALNRGKLNLYLNYPDNPSNQVMNFSYWNNLMGDPGLEIWTAQPQPLNVIYETEIPHGANYLEVTVEDETGQAVSNAWVTVLKGNDEIFATDFTDPAGAILLPLASLTTGEVKLTVTKHNFIPHLGSFNISEAEQFVSLEAINLDDDNFGSSSGNGDGLVNPGEIIELNLLLHNYGTSLVNGISSTISSNSDFVSITSNTADFGSIPAGNSGNSVAPFVVEIASAAAGGTVINFNLLITDNERNQWQEPFSLQIAGPILNPVQLNIFDSDNSIFDPGEIVELTCTISNLGLTPALDLFGTLSCDNYYIEIRDGTGYFGDIEPDTQISNHTDRFTLSASMHVLDGTQIPLQLELYNSSGLSQTLMFNLEIGEVDVHDPLGPDAFGYYCYDDEDDGYETPLYNWIEISPSEAGSGTEIDLYDQGNMGDVETIDLPFTLRFYDIEYNTISVCSNGWLSPGTTTIESFMNWNIPGSLGPSPLIAPFWDDLVIASGDVSYFYDAAQHIFIIEWNNLQNQYNNSTETFQVIIYDNYYYPSSNGNNKLLFQYKEINNVDQGQYSGWTIEHGQYATVGLEDHTSTQGIEYTFNNIYPAAARPLEDEMALLFTGPPIYQEEPFILIGGLLMQDENGNGNADFGETVDLYINLTNLGNQPAQNVSAQLSMEDQYINLLNNSSLYQEISGGSMVANLTPFTFEISNAAPDGHIVEADLLVQESVNNWDLHFTFNLNAPYVVFNSLLVNDGSNNILDPGETSDIIVNLLNTGGAPATDGMFTITSVDEFITINQADYEISSLLPGNSASAVFNVTASENAQIGHQCQINWNFSAAQDYSAEGVFPLVISLVPVVVQETFEEFPPEDWSITPNSNWTQGTWNQAGGTPPEAQFNWYPHSTGEHRLISEPVNTIGSLTLTLEFKHAVSHFSGPYELLIQTSTDGQNWNTAHSYPAGNANPTTETITISTPDVGSDQFKFAFCFSGNSYYINNWWIDDVLLTSTESDTYGYLTGTIALEGGNGFVEQVQIRVGNYAVNPDNEGHYLLPLPTGIYNLTAELLGYATASENNLEISHLQTTTVDLTLHYLTIPSSLEAEVTENDVNLTWDYTERKFPTVLSKQTSKSSISASPEEITRNLTGFNVYRDDVMIHQLLDSQIFAYSDLDLPNGEYTYFVTAQYDNGESDRSNEAIVVIDYNDLPDDQIILHTVLNENYPNPFNPETLISFQLAENGRVLLQIYNIKGQLITTLLNQETVKGNHTLSWSGIDEKGKAVNSGIYFYKLQTEYYTAVRKMLLLK